ADAGRRLPKSGRRPPMPTADAGRRAPTADRRYGAPTGIHACLAGAQSCRRSVISFRLPRRGGSFVSPPKKDRMKLVHSCIARDHGTAARFALAVLLAVGCASSPVDVRPPTGSNNPAGYVVHVLTGDSFTAANVTINGLAI